MTTKYYGSILLFLLCSLSWEIKAQDTLLVDSNNGQFGLLNDVIAGDTIGGERANDVYKLKRGQTYVLSSSIENSGYHLNIVAEDGEGPRPRIVPGRPSGEESKRPFRARADLTLKGLFITGLDDGGFLNSDQRIIRISATDARIVVDDCHLDQDGQSAFRTDSDGIKLYFTNSIMSNIGRPNNTFNGRGLDDRGNNLDTVIFENSTFYNISSTLCNDRGGWIKYAKINNNTIVRTGERIFDFDETQTAIFTNNLVINPGYLGIEDNAEETLDVFLMELDTLGPDAENDLPEIPQTLTYTNNNIYLDSALINNYPKDTSAYPGANWPIVPNTVYNTAFERFAGQTQIATNITEFVAFEGDPGLTDILDIMNKFWLDPNEAGNKLSVPNWDLSGEPFDFSYLDTYASATASSTGEQIGDLKWDLNLTGISGLRQGIDDAQALVDGATVGGNIGNYSQAGIDSLVNAIAEAIVVRDNSGSTEAEINAALDALNDALAFFNGSLVTGIDGIVKPMAGIYPNPVEDHVRFTNSKALQYEILTMSGQLIARDKIDHEKRLSLSSLQAGTYIMRVTLPDQAVSTFRFVKN
ncbi:MAG: T9SS type A sorting domain-containing protein [Bacteroidota bacterium]